MALISDVPSGTPVDDFRATPPLHPDPAWALLFNQMQRACFAVYQSGTTAQYPSNNLWVGRPYFDTTLGYPVFYNGSVFVAAMGLATEGSMLYGLSTGAWAQLAKGAALQQLRMNAGATAPEWATSTGPGLVWLTGGTVASAATLDIVLSSWTGTYKTLVLKLLNFQPATDDVELWLRTSTDGGTTFDAGATDYTYANQGLGSAAYTLISAGNSRLAFASNGAGAAIGNAANESCSVDYQFFDLSETTFNKKIIWNYNYNQSSSGQANTGMGGGFRLATTDIDAVRILFESGNINSGLWNLYGLSSS